MSDDASNIPPGPTPTGYQRTQGGGFKWVPPTPEQLAKLLPQYDIECLLGRGGMGAVYKGTQKSLGRPVAIKILPPEVDDEDTSYTARFKNEAKIMARLSHPGIVAVFDFGETSDGQLYIVMEYIDGSDVAKMVLSQGKLPPEHALAITAHVCDALGYAHANGIIHRDIKPANILINMDGAVKVADFGLAKLDDPGTSGLTKSGMAMGTPDFVAPETLMLGTQADGRADLYAVGVMLYQMLTGQLPRGAFDLPSAISGTDRRFDTIVMKAMKYDRAERYQSSAEIRRDLDVILTAPLVQAGGESSAAIPKQSLPQKPVAKGPQQKAGAAAPKQKAEMGKQSRVPETGGAKSKTPLFIGIGIAAAIAIGAFVMFGGRRPDVVRLSKVESAAPQTATTPNLEVRATPAAPVKAREEPKPAPVVVSSAPKPETPKPAPVKEESKLVAAATPAMPATPPTPSAPVPASSPPPPTLSALDQRITALDTGFQAAVERDAGAAFKANIAALDKLYLTALDRALATATSGGKLEEALALREEKQRIEKGEGVPSEVEESTLAVQPPATLKTLRQTYRSTTAQHEATKLKAMQPLYDKYDQALAAVQTELTKANQLDDAMRVKTVREQIAATRSGGLQPPGASPVASAPSGSSTPPPQPTAAGTSLFGAKAFTNSLGMKYVSVPGTAVLMCIHETRRIDYSIYTKEVRGEDNTWKDPQFQGKSLAQDDDHPVVAVSWDDATAFCDWLSKKERRIYRLPNEHEWNLAVAYDLKDPQAISPADLAEMLGSQNPWGVQLPEKCGNYKGSEDGYEGTAPVMSFLPNHHGIYDLGGNTWEWCRDGFSPGQKERVLRGCGYLNYGGYRVSRTRELTPADYRTTLPNDSVLRVPGFRCVLEVGKTSSSSSPTAKPAAPTSTPPIAPAPTPATAAKGDFTNSLGMKFVKVSGTEVLFCIHETRYKDYASYAAETPGANGQWKNQSAERFTPFGRLEDHPVMNVSWEDAQGFCAWLSKKDGKTYRLPTDQEWSIAVGIGRDEKWKKDTTPATVFKNPTDFPWGDKWPPPKDSGNYCDQSRKAKAPNESAQYLDGYDDGFPTTAPVMSFKPNKLGLYDLSGNVQEWCGDWFDDTNKDRVLRDGSWYFSTRGSLLSSYRGHNTTDRRDYFVGFRVVVETRSPSSATIKPATPTPAPPAAPAPATAAKSDFTNSLGMKFVKVTGTKVLFCIHETRKGDYAKYAAETPGVDDKWKDQTTKEGLKVSEADNHPVVAVDWNDARAFCAWLSGKEGRTYRLPMDREWSYAAGIGKDENPDTAPKDLGQGIRNEYPWGTKYPPPSGSGNYADMTYRGMFPSSKVIDDYTDGYISTAPVMCFKPNKLGIYDLGGNVWEFCEDYVDGTRTQRVTRGASWKWYGADVLLSSFRGPSPPNNRANDLGFRIVLETTD